MKGCGCWCHDGCESGESCNKDCRFEEAVALIRDLRFFVDGINPLSPLSRDIGAFLAKVAEGGEG